MKNVIITGANSGIGKAAAIQYAMHGYRVIMACRNIKASEPVCQEIRQKTTNSNVDLLQLDISSKKSIYAFCEVFKKNYDSLDILINNAGHFKHGETCYQKSIDGFELTFATNLLGPVLLIHLLADVLVKSNRPVVLNACSTNIKHFYDDRRKIDFDVLSGQSIPAKKYNSYHLYGDSKMGLLMATAVMAREYKSCGIDINAIMIPATKLSKSAVKKITPRWRLLAILQSPFVPKAEVIGNAYFSICTSDLYKGITGKLFSHKGQVVLAAQKPMSFIEILTGLKAYPPYGDDKEAARRVLNICNRFIGKDMSV